MSDTASAVESGLVHAVDIDDETLKAYLREANIPALLMAYIHITGDLGIMDGDIRPNANIFGDGEGDLSREQRRQVRDMAFEAIRNYRDGGHVLPPPPSLESLQAMVNFMIGSDVPAEYVPLLQEELGIESGNSCPFLNVGTSSLGSNAIRVLLFWFRHMKVSSSASLFEVPLMKQSSFGAP